MTNVIRVFVASALFLFFRVAICAASTQVCEQQFNILGPNSLTTSSGIAALRTSETELTHLENLRSQLEFVSTSQAAIQEHLFTSLDKVITAEEILAQETSSNFVARSLREKVRVSGLLEETFIQVIEIANLSPSKDLAAGSSGALKPEDRSNDNTKTKLEAFSQFDNLRSDQQIPIILAVFKSLQEQFYTGQMPTSQNLFSSPQELQSKRKVRKSFQIWWNDLMNLDPSMGYLYVASELYIFAESLRSSNRINQISRSRLFRLRSSLPGLSLSHFNPKSTVTETPSETIDYAVLDLIEDDGERVRVLKGIKNINALPLRIKNRLGLLRSQKPKDISGLTSQLDRIESDIAARRQELDQIKSEHLIRSLEGAPKKQAIEELLSNVEYHDMNQFEVAMKKAINALSQAQAETSSKEDVVQIKKAFMSDPSQLSSFLSFEENTIYLSRILDELLKFTEFHRREDPNSLEIGNRLGLHILIIVERLNQSLTKIKLSPAHFQRFYTKLKRVLEQITSPYWGQFNRAQNISDLYSISAEKGFRHNFKLKNEWDIAIASAQRNEINDLIVSSYSHVNGHELPTEFSSLSKTLSLLEKERERLKDLLLDQTDTNLERVASTDGQLQESIYRFHISSLIDKFWNWLRYTSQGNENSDFTPIIDPQEIRELPLTVLSDQSDEFDIEELAESVLPTREKLTLQMTRTTDNKLLALSSFFQRLEAEEREVLGLSASRMAEIDDYRRDLRNYLREISNQSESAEAFIDLIQGRLATLKDFEESFDPSNDYLNRTQDQIEKTRMTLNLILKEFQDYLHFLVNRYDTIKGLRQDLLEYRIRPTEDLASQIKLVIYRN